MTLYCKLCNYAIKPIGPHATSDTEFTMELLAKHLKARHPEDAQSLAVCLVLLSSYLLIHTYARIPPQEKIFQEYMDQAQQELLHLFSEDLKTAS